MTLAPDQPRTVSAPLLKATGITKNFPGLRALDEVSLEVASGEILALVGHNGSGKSTLVKILAGVYGADAGSVEFAAVGEETAELHIIHQNLGLINELSATENLRLAKDPGSRGFTPLRSRKERKRAQQVLARFGEPFPVTIPVSELTPAQRSIVAIARAMEGWQHDHHVLILDEPTEALHVHEVEVLFSAIRQVAAAGAGVVFISHRLDEVLALADRLVVLKDGQKVADVSAEGLNHDDVVSHITGGNTEMTERAQRGGATGETVLSVTGLTGAGIRGVDFTLRAGEVLGIAGVLGSGRDTLLSLVYGSSASQADHFEFSGSHYLQRSPAQSLRRGMGFVAGDRARLGGILPMKARENITLPELRSLRSARGTLRNAQERAVSQRLMQQYQVRPVRTEQVFAQFSGGNQQKIVFAKWLRNNPKLLLLEEPTQGVDIGAKQAIYAQIDQAAQSGVAVLVASSDAKELVRLCDRVLVLRQGQVAQTLQGDQLSESALMVWGYGLETEAAATDEETAHDNR